MEVVIDGRTGLAAGSAGATFGEVFDRVRREVAVRRRVIVSFSLDGEVLSRQRMETLSGKAPPVGALLEVRTADPYRMAVETLAGLQGHLANVEKGLEEAARQFDAGEYTKTLAKFEECFQGWEILLRAVRDIGMLASADFFKLSVEGDSIDWCIRRLQSALLRFETALVTKDVLRLGDIARGELRPQVARWRAVFAVLGDHVARASGSGS